jgi:mannose-1-phosphate guanylyltransferase
MFDVDYSGVVAILSARFKHFGPSHLSGLRQILQEPRLAAASGIIVEISALRTLNNWAIGRFVSFSVSSTVPVAFCGASPKCTKQLQATSCENLICIQDTVADVLSGAAFKRLSLAGHRAVVLAAGNGTRAKPLSFELPKPLFPVLGKPVLDYVIDGCRAFGISEFIVNTCHLGEQIVASQTAAHRRPHEVRFLREEQLHNQFSRAPIGSASTLSVIDRDIGRSGEPFFVFCGDAIWDLDLASMMRAHKQSGAMATIAAIEVEKSEVEKYGIIETARGPSRCRQVLSFQEKPKFQDAKSRLATTGIYIFNSEIAQLITQSAGLDIGSDFLPWLLANAVKVSAYHAQFQWTDIGYMKDMYVANVEAMKGNHIKTPHQMVNSFGRQFIAEDAMVSSAARIEGDVFIDAGGVVEASAWLKGPVIIGKNVHKSPRTLVQESMILDGTRVLPGAIVSGQICGPTWSVDHRFNDVGTGIAASPERVASIDLVAARNQGTQAAYRRSA